MKKSETDVSSLLDGVRCVVISYDLWMYKTTEDIFPMTEHYTRENVREYAHIGISITTSTDGESLTVPVSNVINQFSLGSNIVGIPSDGRTNLARFKAILENNLDNKGVFNLGNTVFVMECLDNVLSNVCRSGVMDLQYDYDRVDTEVTRRNIQRYIT